MSDLFALASDFPSTDREEWLAAAHRVLLRGRPDATDEDAAAAFAKQLVTRTEDGCDLQPLYTAEDAPSARELPGSAPFVRATRASPRAWEIRQRVWSAVDGSRPLTELEQGATGLLLELPSAVSAEMLARLLDGVLLDLAPVSLATPAEDVGFDAARALLASWEAASIAVDARLGSLGIDPIGTWARTGGLVDAEPAIDEAAQLIRELEVAAPRARAIVADGTVWHDAGATDGQELAWTLAGAVACVRGLTEAGVDLGRAFDSIEFRWAATADQFGTITKLRAARRLWARVVELAGGAPSPMCQHADVSRPMLTRYDPWVNALRSTVACFAAAVGGADAITVSPHDLLLEPGGSDLGRRIARNTQTVLMLESNLARVVDMAGGSWYVERRTDELAEVAWRQLQAVDGAGGLVAAVEAGSLREALDLAVAERAKATATRRRPLTGLTEFPNIEEPPPSPFVASDPAPEGTVFEPFTLRRHGEDVERLRGRSDAMEREIGRRPSVFLATLGGLAASTARATFAKNFFELAGIRTVEGPAAEFDSTVTTFACLCSSDAVYEEEAESAARSLRDAGVSRLYIAGRGVGVDEVDQEIGIGSDILAILNDLLDEAGAPR